MLLSLPGVSTVRASTYGAALGDPRRFASADAAYRIAGMHPSTYDSAGRDRSGQKLSRRGSPELRAAIIELGRGLARRDPHFAAYRAALLRRGMPPLKAQVAVGHKAHRLAFRMLLTQQPYDPDRYARSVTDGGERRTAHPATTAASGPVRKNHREAACRHDVTHPPAPTVPRQNSTRKTPLVT